VNEQIRSLSSEFAVDEGSITVICECGDGDCTERMEVPSGVRAGPGRGVLYLIAKGHVLRDLEQVVEEADGYDVVQKYEGTAAEVARETNPRS
jgi:hypothetical protein